MKKLTIITTLASIALVGCEGAAREFRVGWRCGENPTSACVAQSNREYDQIAGYLMSSPVRTTYVPRSGTTKIKYDSRGYIKSITTPYSRSRFHIADDGRIRRIHRTSR